MEKPGIRWKDFVTIGILLMFGIAGYVLLNVVNLQAQSATSKEIVEEIQKIRDAGEPTSIAELVPIDLPDSENGAVVYNQALDLQSELREKYKEEWKYFPYDSLTEWEDVPEAMKERVRNLLLNDTDFAEFYQLIEKASGMKCQLLKRDEYAKGVEREPPLVYMAGLRSYSRLLAARADIRAEKGEIGNALHDCLTCMKISDSLFREPSLLMTLNGLATDSMALDRMKDIIRKGQVTPHTYRLLMEEIAKQRKDKIVYRALLGERLTDGTAFFLWLKDEIKKNRKSAEEVIVDAFGDNTDRKKIISTFRKNPVGFLKERELHYFKTMAKLVDISKKPYFETMEIIPELKKEVSEFPYGDFRVQLLTRGGIFLHEARFDAQLGDAEIAIACHLYRIKHNDYPVSLKELSSEFLPELPLDPFTGKDYIYQKKDKGFIIYSVADNLKDDGGIPQFSEKGKQGDFDIVWEE